MSSFWFVSHISLWLIVGFLLLAVFTLARQVGLLHRRMPPVGARLMNAGLEIGDQAPEINAVDLQGRPVRLGSAQGKRTLLAFVSPTCQACTDLAPALRSLWKSEQRTVDVVLVSTTGNEETNRRFAKRHRLEDMPFIVSPELGPTYHVAASPYALLIDEHGQVQTKGLVNNREQLESLLHAAELGYPSMEHLLEAKEDDHVEEQVKEVSVVRP